MSLTIDADFSVTYLFPQRFEDLVTPVHPARFVRAFVDAIDLKELGLPEHVGCEGRPSYSAKLLLRVWIYGYMNRIRSMRGLEHACRNDIGMMWLTGLHQPDHNTIWRMFKNHRDVLESMFKASVHVAVKMGMVSLVLQALDSTRIGADVNNRTGLFSSKLVKRLAKLDESIAKRLKEFEESSGEGGDAQMPAAAAKVLKDREEAREAVLEEINRLKELGKTNHHDTDPEAPLMQMKGNDSRNKCFGYNTPIVADSQAGIIVASDLSTDASDNALLTGMLEQAEENTGGKAAVTGADGGFFSGKELSAAHGKGHEVVVRTNEGSVPELAPGEIGPGSFRKVSFGYDEADDKCVCPLGEPLPYSTSRQTAEGEVRLYKCICHKACAWRKHCCGGAGPRAIEMGPHEAALRQNREMLKRYKEELEAIFHIVEPEFGLIKWNDKFTRFTVRGQSKSRTQWRLICMAINLRKIYKEWLTKPGAIFLPDKRGDMTLAAA